MRCKSVLEDIMTRLNRMRHNLRRGRLCHAVLHDPRQAGLAVSLEAESQFPGSQIPAK
jgi:hypothetical protein